MKALLFVLCTIVSLALADGDWSQARLARFLCTNSRFYEPDYDEDEAEDPPSRERDRLPLFEDVIRESGWSTNQLIATLISISSNGFSEVGWRDPDKRDAATVALHQLVEINNPLVTNYLHRAVASDMHGYEAIAAPGMIRYTNLEPEVFDAMRAFNQRTNQYARASSMIVFELMDNLKSLPNSLEAPARTRVVKYVYSTIPQINELHDWQDMEIARLVPDYSNSVQRLRLMQQVAATTTNHYQRVKASNVVERLMAIPPQELHDLPWIEGE